MLNDDFDDIEIIDDDDDEQEKPRWSLGRVLYLLVILITLLTFLLHVLWPTIQAVFNPRPPTPIILPRDAA